jgi:hypothetical protein
MDPVRPQVDLTHLPQVPAGPAKLADCRARDKRGTMGRDRSE